MRAFACMLIPALTLALAAQEPAAGPGRTAETKRITLSIRDADLKDVLRAAMEDTDLNLSFEAGLDTRVKSLDLKAVTLEELLEQVLPNLGLGYVRRGRTLHIQKSEGFLRFYQVDHLSMKRQGSKEFTVNASGQLIQATGGGMGGGGGAGASGGGGGAGGGGGTSGATSAYKSTLSTGNDFDPWVELNTGLRALIFGETSSTASPASASPGQVRPPASMAHQKDGKTLMIHPESGVVVVAADATTHARVERYLGELKRRNRRQLLLEARIIEVTLGNDSQIGVDWNGLLSAGAASGALGTDIRGTLTSGVTANPAVAKSEGLAELVIQNARVTAILSALAREGRLKVLSSPRISTLNNQKAILRVVREEAFFMQNSQTTGTGGLSGFSTTVNITPMVVPVGIILDIQPQISDDGTITLAVNPSISEIVTVRTVEVAPSSGSGGAKASLPVVDRRDLDAVVRMRSGETLVLAGIIRTKETTEDRGVPWLRRIPVVGQLFSKREVSKSHTELAIFITPTLTEESDQIQAHREATESRLEEAGATLTPAPRKAPERKDP